MTVTYIGTLSTANHGNVVNSHVVIVCISRYENNTKNVTKISQQLQMSLNGKPTLSDCSPCFIHPLKVKSVKSVKSWTPRIEGPEFV